MSIVPGTALQYGVVNLDLVGSGEITRTPVYDDSDNYRYTLWTLPILGIYNPAANAFSFPLDGGFGDPVPVGPAFNQSPARTEEALRRYLMEPRRVLTYSVGPDIVLQTPVQQPDPAQFGLAETVPPPFATDGANGPWPRYCRINHVHGVKTFIVSYVIEAAIVEDEFFTEEPSVMLSHTWNIQSNLDEDFYETRTIRGTATFRTDVLLARNVVPDDFRSYLSQPIAPGFKRDDVFVDLLEDGTGVRYAVVDRRKALSVVASNQITRIQATMAANVYKPNKLAGVAGGIIPLVGANGHLQTAQNVGNIITSVLERMGVEVVVRVWGVPTAQKTLLQNVAMNLIVLKLQDAFGGPGGGLRGTFAGSTVSVLWDLAGRYVEATAVVQSPTINAGSIDINPFIAIPDPRDYMPAQDDIPNILVGGVVGTSNLPPNSDGMRGDNIRSLVAAALREPYLPPVGGGAVTPFAAQDLSPP